MKLKAAKVCALLGLLFMVVYHSCNAISTVREATAIMSRTSEAVEEMSATLTDLGSHSERIGAVVDVIVCIKLNKQSILFLWFTVLLLQLLEISLQDVCVLVLQRTEVQLGDLT